MSNMTESNSILESIAARWKEKGHSVFVYRDSGIRNVTIFAKRSDDRAILYKDDGIIIFPVISYKLGGVACSMMAPSEPMYVDSCISAVIGA